MNTRASLIERLELAGAFASAPTGRGQPSLTSSDVTRFYRRLAIRVAMQVMTEAYRIGDRRGSQARAIELVAMQYSKRQGGRPFISPATIKTYVKRYGKHVAGRALLVARVETMNSEIERRTLGFPDDVKRKLLETVAPVRFLEYLRAHDIDGTCPKALIDQVRAQSR